MSDHLHKTKGNHRECKMERGFTPRIPHMWGKIPKLKCRQLLSFFNIYSKCYLLILLSHIFLIKHPEHISQKLLLAITMETSLMKCLVKSSVYVNNIILRLLTEFGIGCELVNFFILKKKIHKIFSIQKFC